MCRRVAGLLPRLLLVIFFVEAGLLLLVLPWSGFWERNYFLQAWPQVQPLFANGYIRGGVSGIGVLNLAAALVEFGRALAGRE